MSGFFRPGRNLRAAQLNRVREEANRQREIGEIAGLVDALAGKSNVGHTHGAADIVSGLISPARLGSGTADATTFLRGDGAWLAPTDILGRVRCVRTTNQSIPNNTSTLVTWDAEDYDTGGYHDNAVNPSRITVPAGAVTGEIRCYIGFANNTTGTVRAVDVVRNGAGTYVANNSLINAAVHPNGPLSIQATTGRMPVTPGDHYECFAFHNISGGGALNLLGPGGTRAAPSWFEAIFYTA